MNGRGEAEEMVDGEQRNPARHNGQHYFPGPVQEAINLCRKDQRFLLIFLKGGDQVSYTADEAIHALLGGQRYHCIALRLHDDLANADAQAFKKAKNFREIFPDIRRLPFLMLLGPDGRPLASLEGEDVPKLAAHALQAAAAKYPSPEQDRQSTRQSVDSSHSSHNAPAASTPHSPSHSQPPTPGSQAGSIFQDPLPTVQSPSSASGSASGSRAIEDLPVSAPLAQPATGNFPSTEIGELGSALAEAVEQAAIFSAVSTRNAVQNQQTQADVESWRQNEPQASAALLAPSSHAPSPPPTPSRSSLDSRATDEVPSGGPSRGLGAHNEPERAAEALKSALEAGQTGSHSGTLVGQGGVGVPSQHGLQGHANAAGLENGRGTAEAEGGSRRQLSDSSIVLEEALQFRNSGPPSGGAPPAALSPGAESAAVRAQRDVYAPPQPNAAANAQPQPTSASTAQPLLTTATTAQQQPPAAVLSQPLPRAAATAGASPTATTQPLLPTSATAQEAGGLQTAFSLGDSLEDSSAQQSARGEAAAEKGGIGKKATELETAGSFSFHPKADTKIGAVEAAREAAVARAGAAAERKRLEAMEAGIAAGVEDVKPLHSAASPSTTDPSAAKAAAVALKDTQNAAAAAIVGSEATTRAPGATKGSETVAAGSSSGKAAARGPEETKGGAAGLVSTSSSKPETKVSAVEAAREAAVARAGAAAERRRLEAMEAGIAAGVEDVKPLHSAASSSTTDPSASKAAADALKETQNAAAAAIVGSEDTTRAPRDTQGSQTVAAGISGGESATSGPQDTRGGAAGLNSSSSSKPATGVDLAAEGVGGRGVTAAVLPAAGVSGRRAEAAGGEGSAVAFKETHGSPLGEIWAGRSGEDVVQDPGLTNIAVRLTDGSFLRAEFLSDAPLDAVIKYVEKNRTDGWRPFSLRTPFPYRFLDASHGRQTLQELDLSPRTLLVLHPIDAKKAAITQGQAGFTNSVVSGAATVAHVAKVWITALVAILIGFFSGLFSSSGQTHTRPRQNDRVLVDPRQNSATSQPGTNPADRSRQAGAAPASWGVASSSKGGAVSNLKQRRQPGDDGTDDAA